MLSCIQKNGGQQIRQSHEAAQSDDAGFVGRGVCAAAVAILVRVQLHRPGETAQHGRTRYVDCPAASAACLGPGRPAWDDNPPAWQMDPGIPVERKMPGGLSAEPVQDASIAVGDGQICRPGATRRAGCGQRPKRRDRRAVTGLSGPVDAVPGKHGRRNPEVPVRALGRRPAVCRGAAVPG